MPLQGDLAIVEVMCQVVAKALAHTVAGRQNAGGHKGILARAKGVVQHKDPCSPCLKAHAQKGTSPLGGCWLRSQRPPQSACWLDNPGLVSQSGTCHPIAPLLPWWQRKVSPVATAVSGVADPLLTPLQPRAGQDQQQRKAPWNFRKSRRSTCSSPGFRDFQRTNRYRLVAMQSADMQTLRVFAFML